MIQRIHTVWLAVACGALAAAGAAGAVLLFRNRPQQRRIVVLVQVTVIVLAVALFGGMYLAGELHIRTA